VIEPNNEAMKEADVQEGKLDKVEFNQGMGEFWEKTWGVLRDRFPAIFSKDRETVRPLSLGIVQELSGAMGWSESYTKGALKAWKLSPVYCHAILRHRERVSLDGSPVPGQEVNEEAREMARRRLTQCRDRRNNRQKAAAPAESIQPTAPSPVADEPRAAPAAVIPMPEPPPEPDTGKPRKTLSLKAPPPRMPVALAGVVVREIETPRRAKSRAAR
jgi:sRNA-binding protein